MKIRLGMLVGMFGAVLLAGTAPSHATVVTNGIEISSSGSCLGGLDCSGTFTVDNQTSDWDITGFSVTDTLGFFDSSESVNATTARTDWSGSASVNLVDQICFFGNCFGGEPQPTFTYNGSGNFILPGQFDGSFDWSESINLGDPIYSFLIFNTDTDASTVCDGNLSSLAPGSSSFCSLSLAPVPEPSSLPMLLAGLGMIGGAFYFGRKKVLLAGVTRT
jgi:hypothetical protein